MDARGLDAAAGVEEGEEDGGDIGAFCAEAEKAVVKAIKVPSAIALRMCNLHGWFAKFERGSRAIVSRDDSRPCLEKLCDTCEF